MAIAEPRAPLFVDNSLLSSVDCSTDVALRHVHHYTSLKDRAPIRAGSACHHALDTWFQHKDKLKAMAAFEEHYRDFADENVEDPEDRLTWENTSSILDNWLDTKGVELIKDVEIIPGMVEVGFAYPLGIDAVSKPKQRTTAEFTVDDLKRGYEGVDCEFIMCGRFDMLVRWKKSNSIYVWENKSTGSVARLKDTIRFGSQFADYLWAAKKILAQMSPLHSVQVSGVFVNAIEFRKMPGSDRRCNTHGVKYSECKFMHLGHAFLGPVGRSPEALVEWEKTAVHLAKRYRDILTKYPKISDVPKLRTQGQFEYGRCPNCTFADFCLAGRPMAAIDAMLKVEAWSPFDGVIENSQALFMQGEVVRK